MKNFLTKVQNSKQAMLYAIGAIWISTLLAYSNSFSISFQFDDTHTIQSNLYIRSLKYAPQYFIDPKTSSYRPESSGYRPMTTLATALGFAISHNQTWGYHLIKWAEHCVVATFLFLVGLRLLPTGGAAAPYRWWIAFLAALVFGVHRINTEVVDYISAISSLQAGMFFIIAFYLYLRWRETKASRYFAFSIACYLFSMWSKEEGATLPAMIFLYEWIYAGTQERPVQKEELWDRLRKTGKQWVKVIIPSNGEAWEIMAKAQMFRGQYAEAGRVFFKLFQGTPRSKQYLLNMANLFERGQKWAMARTYYEKTVAEDPNMIQAWMGLERIGKQISNASLASEAQRRIQTLKQSNNWKWIAHAFLPGEKSKQFGPY